VITPPALTPCFYTTLFEKPVASQFMKLMAPVTGGDIEQVLVTSLDMDSDIQALRELQTGVDAMILSLGGKFDRKLTFNPLYLPMKPDELVLQLEVAKNGEIQSVVGFDNPFISMHLQFSTEERPDAVDGKICFKPFQLPQFNEMIENKTLPS
jgi:hypothetical protein